MSKNLGLRQVLYIYPEHLKLLMKFGSRNLSGGFRRMVSVIELVAEKDPAFFQKCLEEVDNPPVEDSTISKLLVRNPNQLEEER